MPHPFAYCSRFRRACRSTRRLQEERRSTPRQEGMGPFPLLRNLVENGHSPLLTMDEARDMGFRITIFSFTALVPAYLAIKKAFERLKTEGVSDNHETEISRKTISMSVIWGKRWASIRLLEVMNSRAVVVSFSSGSAAVACSSRRYAVSIDVNFSVLLPLWSKYGTFAALMSRA